MADLDMKYGFPLFTKQKSNVYLGNHKKLIISDIWAFWDYVIKKHGKDQAFLSALLEQAKHFYNSAENSPTKSKPLLFYYSFLNLSKIIISIEKGYGNTDSFMHGVVEKHNNNFAASTINVKSKQVATPPWDVALNAANTSKGAATKTAHAVTAAAAANPNAMAPAAITAANAAAAAAAAAATSISAAKAAAPALPTTSATLKNVAIELIEILDVNLPATPWCLNVKDLLAHCVGVHRAYCEIYNMKEKFYRLADLQVASNGRDLVFTAEVICKQNSLPPALLLHYPSISRVGNKFIYECRVTSVTSTLRTRINYYNLSQKLRQEGIWYFIGNDGYTHYLSEHGTNRFSPESIIYCVMFYLGSITRYHPYMFDNIFSDKEQWLMSEFLTTQPKQFLYLATSKVLGQQVLKAYASF